MPHNFWMINCNEANFNITRSLGFTRQGLKAEYRRKVQRVEPDDRIIYYVTGIRVFAATATVTEGYQEVPNSQPWANEGKSGWPYRIGIKPGVILAREQYIDAGLLAYRLEYLRKWPPEDWPLAFQGNLHLLSRSDFFLLETEMRKLRYGREETLRLVEQELAEEAERWQSQRERRRRNSPPPEPPARGGGSQIAAVGRAVAAAAAGQDQAAPPARPAGGNSPRRNRRPPRNGGAGRSAKEVC